MRERIQRAQRVEEASGLVLELPAPQRSRSPQRLLDRKAANESRRRGTRTTVRWDVLVQLDSWAHMAAWDAQALLERGLRRREQADMARNDWQVATTRLERRLQWHQDVRDWVSAEGRRRLGTFEPWPSWLELRRGEPA